MRPISKQCGLSPAAWRCGARPLIGAFSALAAGLLCSCSTQLDPRLTAHVIMADQDGQPLNPLTQQSMDRNHYQLYLDSLVANLKANAPTDKDGKKKVLIFVHGGLNTQKDSLQRANAFFEPILTGPTNGYYPIFINWPSGLTASYGEHLLRIRQGRKESLAYGLITSPLYLAADLGQSIARGPTVLLENYKSTDLPNATFSETPYDKNATNFDFFQSPNFDLFSVPRTNFDFSDKTVFKLNPSVGNANVLSRALLRRERTNANAMHVSLGHFERHTGDDLTRLGTYIATLPTKVATMGLIDALGKNAWDNMLRRTPLLFQTEEEFDISTMRNDPQEVDRSLDTKSGGAVSRFLYDLAKKMTNENYEITLVGHSMGAIVLNEAIRNYPTLPYSNIVYMAAACTIADAQSALIPYLRTNKSAQFYNLCLHPLNDARERVAGDLPPRGSLLEWIDNFLSSPGTPLERTFGKWDNILQCTFIFPNEIRSRIYLKGFGNHEVPTQDESQELKNEGLENIHFDKFKSEKDDPLVHGDFGLRPYWRDSFWRTSPLDSSP